VNIYNQNIINLKEALNMRCTEAMKKAVLRVGMAMAKVDAKTSCPWINYQPSEPEALIKMRHRINSN
jgi:cyclic lactone autoinducer peptide